MGKLLKILHFLSITLFLMVLVNASVSSPLSIDINNSLSGAIASNSEISPNSNNRSEYYAFTLTEENRIVVSLESDFYHKFYLLDSNGTIVKEASKYDYLSDKIVLTLAAGNYMVDVTSVFNDNYGAFTLSLKENIIHTIPVVLESIVDGEWTANSLISENTSQYANYYTFTLDNRTDILIDLDSYNSYLYLFDSNGTKIENASGNSFNHAKIVTTLEAGEYRLEVTNAGFSSGFGIYTLRFKTNNILTETIDVNSRVDGVWNISSGISPRSKNYTQYYTFTLSEEKDIVIDVTTNLSSRIYLLDSNNSVIERTINGPTRILLHLKAGVYTVDITQVNSSRSGNYTLLLRENIVSVLPIELNSSIAGQWSNNSGYSPRTKNYTNYYVFVLYKETDIIIEMDAESDQGFYLLDANGTVIDEYRQFGRVLVKKLKAGTYIIDATIYNNNVGLYTLSVAENIIESKNINLNSSIIDSFSGSDGISKYGYGYAKRYTFELDDTKDILIDVNSSHKLYLFDDNGTMIDDEYGRLVCTLNKGKYTIEIATQSDKQLADFVLILRENIILTKSIVFNQITDGLWTSQSGLSIYGNYLERYTFDLSETTVVSIQLNSEYSHVLRLYNENRYISSRSWNDIGAHIETELEKGTYTIDVIIDVMNKIHKIGEFTLLVEANVSVALPVNNLYVEIVDAYSSIIKWQKGNDSTVGYKIYLNGVFIADVDVLQSSYTIGGLSPESEYSYSVVAYNSAGESTPMSGTTITKKDDYAWLVPVQYMILN